MIRPVRAEVAWSSDGKGGGAVDASYFLHERYAKPGASRRLLRPYYRLKPFLPRRLQLAVRRAYSHRQARRKHPAWPIEPILVEHQHAEFRRKLAAAGAPRVPFVNFWPDSHRFAFILTHDVEGPAGVENIPQVLEVERRHNVVSSWNFVAEDYAIPPGLFEELHASGCEVGLHGITHDGSLFRDRASFEAQLPSIRRHLREWGAAGFRSPATHRNADWIPELGCLYDSSFPDTDPFEPQPGGCCSIFPFFFGEVVELPITLTQDHTLFEVLRERTIRLWLEKSEWIIRHHGLINVIVHPDYMLAEEHLRLYDELLQVLTEQPGGWHALPRDVARWWKTRAELEAKGVDPHVAAGNGEPPHPTVAYAREAGGRIVFDLEPAE